MSYTDPPPRRPWYPVPAPYEDGYVPQAAYPDATDAPPWEAQTQNRPGFGPPDLGQSYFTPEPSALRDYRNTGGFPGAADYRDTSEYRGTPEYRDAPEYGQPPDQRRRSRGLLTGGAIGFLAAAVAIGVANLVAAFVRPQASPIIAVGGAFIDRTPPALKNFAVQKFGENDKNMLLLGMYVTIALIAIVIGTTAWRHVSIGVAGIGIFGLFGAFVAITRPESHTTDVIPSIIGGITGIVAIVWLIHIGTSDRRYGAYPAEGGL
jgi:hypothetical protein